MSSGLLTLLTFLAVVSAVMAVYSILADLFLRDRSRVQQRVDEEFRQEQREQVRKSLLLKNLSQLAADVAAEENGRLTLRRRFENFVEQSGSKRSAAWWLTLALTLGAVVGFGSGLIRQSALTGAALGPLAACAPLFYLNYKGQTRRQKLTNQLPDAFDLMARAVRAGHTVARAMQAVADEFAQPIAAEFSYCYEQQNLGLPPETALRDLARRTGLLEIKILVLALVVQQTTGGNIAQMLDNLAGVVRERIRMRGKVRALTAEGRLQAAVLLALPPALLLFILFFNRNYGQALLDHKGLLVGTLVSEMIGAAWIRKIVNFDF